MNICVDYSACPCIRSFGRHCQSDCTCDDADICQSFPKMKQKQTNTCWGGAWIFGRKISCIKKVHRGSFSGVINLGPTRQIDVVISNVWILKLYCQAPCFDSINIKIVFCTDAINTIPAWSCRLVLRAFWKQTQVRKRWQVGNCSRIYL